MLLTICYLFSFGVSITLNWQLILERHLHTYSVKFYYIQSLPFNSLPLFMHFFCDCPAAVIVDHVGKVLNQIRVLVCCM